MALEEETRERIMRVFEWGKRAFHVGFIPFILYLGFTQSSPRPSLLRLISPLAA
ncbi:hypothetical protein M427DRAFT_54608 [Gonapodya prolifera JEL478]|uniref:Tom7-domain-containing protein n=1 Tax=Gonapodya prolifera (strain JEL478) TaxID=1344416 RepID=A0A139AKT4_GONPJ|nr:hypothetical protein M427DRAFT_54608 [Gonapodya prolifera JEL478]|eukprot:KXS17308.1 hypothetical protein M427DRAFT_54608 [Gonapodya prolifera JEL478]